MMNARSAAGIPISLSGLASCPPPAGSLSTAGAGIFDRYHPRLGRNSFGLTLSLLATRAGIDALLPSSASLSLD